MRSILSNGSHNVDCFKRADIINALCHLGYIDRAEHTYYDIARTVSAALKKARYTGLIRMRYDQYGSWRNEYSFDSDSDSAAALEGETAKKENPMTSYHNKFGNLKREARTLYDNISCLDGEFANVKIKTLKDYSSKELLEELQRRVEAKNSL
jgi:hypothetical protein